MKNCRNIKGSISHKNQNIGNCPHLVSNFQQRLVLEEKSTDVFLLNVSRGNSSQIISKKRSG